MKLKFRAYHKVKKEWLFGYNYQNLGGFNLIGEVVLMGELNRIKLEDWNNIDITQFTGLKDKNKEEIYDNDIIYFKALGNTYKKPCGWMKAKVVITPYRLELHSENGYIYSAYDETEDFPYKNCEKIGNVYDNKELLESFKEIKQFS